MKRIIDENHIWNSENGKYRIGEFEGKTIHFRRGVIVCDNVPVHFIGQGNTREQADEEFESFLSPECICVLKNTKPCPIHLKKNELDGVSV